LQQQKGPGHPATYSDIATLSKKKKAQPAFSVQGCFFDKPPTLHSNAVHVTHVVQSRIEVFFFCFFFCFFWLIIDPLYETCIENRTVTVK